MSENVFTSISQNTKDRFSAPAFLAVFVLFLFVLAINQHVITFAYVLLCIWALLGPKQAIQALSLNYVILLLNPALYTLPAGVGVLRWLILFIAGLRVLPFFSARSLRYLIPLFFFFMVTVALSWVTSPKFNISFLKITVFTFCAGTVLTAFNSLDKIELKDLEKWFFCLTFAVILISVPTVLIPGIGFLRNGRGFQGILNHPQAFGTFLAPIAACLGARLLFGKGEKKLWLWFAGGAILVLIFMSQARTAMVTLVLSVGFTLAIALFCLRQKSSEWAPTGAVIKLIAVSAIFFCLLAFSPLFSKTIEGFVLKEHGENAEDAFYKSRGIGISFYWNRFLEHPMIGNGFGVDVAHSSDKNTATFLGIPISATTEKGFLPVAFLEEVGIVGLIFFAPFFLNLIVGTVKTGNVALIAMFMGCLFVNVGEAVFFSPGQTGGYLWLLIGLCTAKGWQHSA